MDLAFFQKLQLVLTVGLQLYKLVHVDWELDVFHKVDLMLFFHDPFSHLLHCILLHVMEIFDAIFLKIFHGI